MSSLERIIDCVGVCSDELSVLADINRGLHDAAVSNLEMIRFVAMEYLGTDADDALGPLYDELHAVAEHMGTHARRATTFRTTPMWLITSASIVELIGGCCDEFLACGVGLHSACFVASGEEAPRGMRRCASILGVHLQQYRTAVLSAREGMPTGFRPAVDRAVLRDNESLSSHQVHVINTEFYRATFTIVSTYVAICQYHVAAQRHAEQRAAEERRVATAGNAFIAVQDLPGAVDTLSAQTSESIVAVDVCLELIGSLRRWVGESAVSPTAHQHCDMSVAALGTFCERTLRHLGELRPTLSFLLQQVRCIKQAVQGREWYSAFAHSDAALGGVVAALETEITGVASFCKQLPQSAGHDAVVAKAVLFRNSLQTIHYALQSIPNAVSETLHQHGLSAFLEAEAGRREDVELVEAPSPSALHLVSQQHLMQARGEDGLLVAKLLGELIALVLRVLEANEAHDRESCRLAFAGLHRFVPLGTEYERMIAAHDSRQSAN